MKYCYLLLENTEFEHPIDVAFSLKELAERHNIPLQTLKNALSTQRVIRYVNCRVERVRLK